MFATFEGFDESEGAWIDDEDDWQWVPIPAAGVPVALPVAGAWRPGVLAGPLEKIYLARVSEQTGGAEFLVKWKGLAHIHSQWVPQRDLEAEISNKQRVQRFLKAQVYRLPSRPSHRLSSPLVASRESSLLSASSGPRGARLHPLLSVPLRALRAQALAEAGGVADNTWDIGGDEGDEGGRAARTDEEPYNPDFEIVERIVAEASSDQIPPYGDDLPPRFLVKWRSLP